MVSIEGDIRIGLHFQFRLQREIEESMAHKSDTGQTEMTIRTTQLLSLFMRIVNARF